MSDSATALDTVAFDEFVLPLDEFEPSLEKLFFDLGKVEELTGKEELPNLPDVLEIGEILGLLTVDGLVRLARFGLPPSLGELAFGGELILLLGGELEFSLDKEVKPSRAGECVPSFGEELPVPL